MIDLVEAMEEDGAIIALDQEKVYNKIDHMYLWETLKAFGLPERFILTIRLLYTGAHTQIIINGVLSSTWDIYQGT